MVSMSVLKKTTNKEKKVKIHYIHDEQTKTKGRKCPLSDKKRDTLKGIK